MRIKVLVVAAIMGGMLAGCGSSDSSAKDDPVTSHGAESANSAAPAASNPNGPKVKVVGSDYGRILADGRGRALYLFTSDHGKGSSCSGACATAWPPYVLKSKPTALSGAKPGLAGTTRRDDGRLQATYRGRPLYYYEGDRSPGEVNCQAAVEFGGYWYVLRGNGRAVR